MSIVNPFIFWTSDYPKWQQRNRHLQRDSDIERLKIVRNIVAILAIYWFSRLDHLLFCFIAAIIDRLDRGLAGIFQELDKNAGTSSSLAEQVTDLKKLSPEVVIMQRELLNFVLQLPTGDDDNGFNTEKVDKPQHFNM